MRGKWIRALWILPVCFVVLASGCDDDDPVRPVDREKPAVPRGVTSITGDRQVEILWFPNEEWDLDGYRVYRGLELYGTYDEIGWVPAQQNAYEIAYLDTRVTNGRTYYYAISAVDYTGNESDLSWEEVFDTPRPAGFGVVLRNYNETSIGSSYDFSRERVTDFEDLAADIAYTWDEENGAWMLGLDDPNSGYVTELQDAGYARMDDITWAPPSGWSPLAAVELIEGHVYVAWTRPPEDNYAKFRVVRITPREVEFDWAFQIDPGNQELSAEAEVEPLSAESETRRKAPIKRR